MRISILIVTNLLIASALALTPVFIDTEALHKIIQYTPAENVRVLDCSVDDDMYQNFHKSHIPGASLIDFNFLRDQNSKYPYMLPPQDQFQAQMMTLNIKKSTRVITYDSTQGYHATRCYWMLRVYGHENVSVLDGGFNKWKSEKRPLESTPGYGDAADYEYTLQKDLYRSFEQILELEVLIKNKETLEQIADARPQATFDAGHIEGAIDVWWKLLQNDDGTVKSPSEIIEIASSKGIDINNPITTTCQTGMSASWLYASFQHAGNKKTALYDGSYAEYSDRKKKETKNAGRFLH